MKVVVGGRGKVVVGGRGRWGKGKVVVGRRMKWQGKGNTYISAITQERQRIQGKKSNSRLTKDAGP